MCNTLNILYSSSSSASQRSLRPNAATHTRSHLSLCRANTSPFCTPIFPRFSTILSKRPCFGLPSGRFQLSLQFRTAFIKPLDLRTGPTHDIRLYRNTNVKYNCGDSTLLLISYYWTICNSSDRIFS